MSAASHRSRTSDVSSAAAGACSPPVDLDDDHRGGAAPPEEEQLEVRRGPWTVDEDLTLVNYINDHGEGRWNSLSRAAGLKRTGKSCRLRWLNYLRPDVKRGNLTADEQLLILDLHTRWGNRWSKIAQHLPGRTDNEIKNYWRTRVQKHAKQLNCDANSKRFKDAMRYLWMPHLVDVDDHRRRLYAAAHHHNHLAAGADVFSATVAAGMVMASPSSDSLATTAEESSYDDVYANNLNDAGMEMLVTGGGGAGDSWMQETASQELGMWSSSAVEVAGGGGQFQDPELSGWVQGFSGEGISENFWALEDIWKIQ